MKTMRIASFAFVVFVAGCAPQSRLASLPSPQFKTLFSADEHKTYSNPGQGSIAGQAFLRQRGGGVVTCAGAAVLLFPATPYYFEWAKLMRVYPSVPEHLINPDAKKLVKTTTCNAQGNFGFNGLAHGKWLAMTSVHWTVGRHEQGGPLSAVVNVTQATSQTTTLVNDDAASNN